MIDSKDRFSQTAATYDIYRPSYPGELVDWIISSAHLNKNSLIADIGCGTGIASRLFAKKGFHTIGIEPNKEMLAIAIEKNGGPKYQLGSAEETGLSNHIIDLVISAEAFHWFNIVKTMQELQRILKPQRFSCAFWNTRAKTPLLEEYDKLLKSYSSEYKTMRRQKQTIADIKNFHTIETYHEKEFKNSQRMDLNGLIKRAYTVSYIVHGVKNHDEFKRKLEELFDKYQSDGMVTFHYKTVAILWNFKSK